MSTGEKWTCTYEQPRPRCNWTSYMPQWFQWAFCFRIGMSCWGGCTPQQELRVSSTRTKSDISAWAWRLRWIEWTMTYSTCWDLRDFLENETLVLRPLTVYEYHWSDKEESGQDIRELHRWKLVTGQLCWYYGERLSGEVKHSWGNLGSY